jgi:TfoX/Sxy family transcriptional regulator of competence genes
VVYNEALARRVRIVLAAQPEVEEKRMFGGLSFMVGGQMCCGVLKDDLVVRVGSEQFDEVLAQPDVRPFDFTGRPSTGMVYVASTGLSSEQVLRVWVQHGLNYVKAHPKATKPAKRKR